MVVAYVPCHVTSPDFLEKKSLGKKKVELHYMIQIKLFFKFQIRENYLPYLLQGMKMYLWMIIDEEISMLTSADRHTSAPADYRPERVGPPVIPDYNYRPERVGPPVIPDYKIIQEDF